MKDFLASLKKNEKVNCLNISRNVGGGGPTIGRTTKTYSKIQIVIIFINAVEYFGCRNYAPRINSA